MTYDEISQGIYAFRQIVTPDTISPDGLGNILDQILQWANARLSGLDELVHDCADAEEVDARLSALRNDLQKAAADIAALRRDIAECADARTTAQTLEDHDTRIRVLLQELTELENRITDAGDIIAVESITDQEIESIIQNPLADKVN